MCIAAVIVKSHCQVCCCSHCYVCSSSHWLQPQFQKRACAGPFRRGSSRGAASHPARRLCGNERHTALNTTQPRHPRLTPTHGPLPPGFSIRNHPKRKPPRVGGFLAIKLLPSSFLCVTSRSCRNTYSTSKRPGLLVQYLVNCLVQYPDNKRTSHQ